MTNENRKARLKTREPVKISGMEKIQENMKYDVKKVVKVMIMILWGKEKRRFGLFMYTFIQLLKHIISLLRIGVAAAYHSCHKYP